MTENKCLFPRLLLSLGAALIALVAAELILRIIDQPRFPEPKSDPVRFVFTDRATTEGPLYLNKPGRITFRYDGNPRGYFDELNEVHHDVSPTGFRGPAFTPKSEGTYRMVFLGDSFTFGEGVQNQDTYAEVAARILRKEGRRAESFNLGVGGYNTSQEAVVLDLFGFDLQPDAVILGYTINDAEPPLFLIDPASGKPRRREREAFLEEAGTVDKPPYRLRLAQLVWQRRNQRKRTTQTIDYYRSLRAPSSEGRIDSERALVEIIAQCKERDMACIVVMFPILHRLGDDYPLKDIHEQIGEVVRKSGGRCIDLLPALKGRDPRKLMVHATDQHPNEKVHEIAGQLVAAEIVRLRRVGAIAR